MKKTTYEEKSVEPKKLIVLAVEGAVTEHIYFNYLQKNQQNFDFKSIVRLKVLKRNSDDIGKSAPTHLVNELQTFLEDSEKIQEIKGDIFDNEYDILGIVADIEKSEDRKVNLNKAIQNCNDNSIQFFLTNPCFEFWLLLHFDISEYCHEVLFENKKVSKTKRYIDRELSLKLEGYSKKNKGYEPSRFVSKESVKLALSQEKSFENNLDNIFDKLGSNIGSLITEILDI